MRVLRRAFQIYLRRKDPISFARGRGVKIGERCRVAFDVEFGTEPYLVSIGNHCELTAQVRFVTHDGGVWVFRDDHPEWDRFGRVVLGDNVYIGIRSIVMPGVSIGDNCVVGAGSIVTRDIPGGSVAAGVPARVIRSLEEYRARCEERSLPTKRLSAIEKRRFLEEQFRTKGQL